MEITYDPEADAVAIVLREDATVENSTDIEDGVTIWLDRQGHIVGLEVLDASHRLGPDPLAHVAIERYGKPQQRATKTRVAKRQVGTRKA